MLKKNKMGRDRLPRFKYYYKVVFKEVPGFKITKQINKTQQSSEMNAPTCV